MHLISFSLRLPLKSDCGRKKMVMNKPIKIKVPVFTDDPLAGGRHIFPLPFLSFRYGGRGSIIIKNSVLTYVESRFATSSPKSFDLSKILKLLIIRTRFSPFTKDFKLNSESFRAQYYLELLFVNKNGNRDILIPSFAENTISKKQWEKFLNKLKVITCLPLEQIETVAEKKS
jgi:hypothetical protein